MPKINYIDQINGFWEKSKPDDLKAIDVAVYFAILNYCNSLLWTNPFVCHWEIVCQYSKCSKNAFYTSIKRLDSKGYLKYSPGKRNQLQPKIAVLQFENRKGTEREQNREQHEEQNREQKGNISKQLNVKTNKLINYIYIQDKKIFNLKSWFQATRGIWANDFPKRNKFNLGEMCEKFMIEKNEQVFNDANHVQNSLVRFVAKERKSSGQKKEQTRSYVDESLAQIERLTGIKSNLDQDNE